jgi:hypothetical protein
MAADAPSPELDADALGAVADAVSSGRCLLFLGAGVHAPPPQGSQYVYPEDARPPLGSTLSERLAKKCKLADTYPNESPHNLGRVSLFFETLKTREELVEEIRAAVHTGKKPSPILHALAELDFPLVITTNYDKLFDRALVLADKDPRLSIYSKSGLEPTLNYEPTCKEPLLLKIHGDVDHQESIVVTDEDYIHFMLRMGDIDPFKPASLIVRAHMLTWPTLFVGYSLLDYNLRLLFQTLRWKVDLSGIPSMYSVDPYADPLIVEGWEHQRRYVKFIAQDVWTFVPALYRAIQGKEMPDYDN